MAIGEFLLKYWLQVLLGMVVTLLGVFRKKIKAWRDAHKKQESEQLKNSIVKEVKEALDDLTIRSDKNDEMMRGQINELRMGLLTIQGDAFKAKCRELLKEDCTITIDQFENLERDHQAYNGLGGNHTGDQLFELVKTRFESSFHWCQ